MVQRLHIINWTGRVLLHDRKRQNRKSHNRLFWELRMHKLVFQKKLGLPVLNKFVELGPILDMYRHSCIILLSVILTLINLLVSGIKLSMKSKEPYGRGYRK